jgi:alpha(1,3/1,4) fucosyltransferase
MNIIFNILIFLILIFIFIILFRFKYIYKEEFIQKNVSLNNWWENKDDISLNIFKNIFQDQTKNIEIYSVFGEPNITRNNNTLYIQYSGESSYKDPSLFDINFIPSTKSDNIIVFPYAAFSMIFNKFNINYFIDKRKLHKINDNFCLFAVSNGNSSERNLFYNELSKYKKVDSCGRYLNNMDMNCPGSHSSKEFHNFISKYKFMICFENDSKPNYFTEKLINTYYNGVIPIYWGCPNINEYINMDSILYLKPNFTQLDIDDLIYTIKELDNDPNKYKQKYESVFFKDGIIPDEFNINKIRDNVNNFLKINN